MKHEILLLVIAVSIFCSSVAGQNAGGKINGIVKDAKGTSMGGATVMLLLAKDSSIKKTVAANSEGSFVFKNLGHGTYIITGSFTGYMLYKSAAFTIDDTHETIILPVIVLQAVGNAALKKVVVTTQKKLVEHKIDRTIINVDAMITAAGTNVLEVLGKSPGVTVDLNGGISLYGMGGVLVLIDDKETYMPAQDLAAYLRSLPGSMVDKIELMSNPPAKYDASGRAIINIILKKNRAAGFNGNLNVAYNQGMYGRTSNALNANYRFKQLNIFGNIGYNEDRNFTDENLNRNYIDPGGAAGNIMLMGSRYKYVAKSVTARAGIDYFSSPHTTFGILLTAGTRPRTENRYFASSEYNAGMKLDSTTTGSTIGDYQSRNLGVNFNFQHKFDSTGKQITADADHIHYYSAGSQVAPTYVYLPGGSLSSYTKLMNTIPADVNILSVKADYTQPLTGNARLDAGFKSSYVITDDASNWFNQVGGTFISDDGKTNHFIYKENTNALYISATKDWKRFSLQGGLRVENTISRGHQLGNINAPDSSFTRRRTIVFPTIYILYKLDSNGNHTIVFSYGVRIRRPNYQQLNPFVAYRDKYSYTGGNPFLNPELNHVFDLAYSYVGAFGISFTYLHVHDNIYNLAQTVGNTICTRPQNFGTDYSFNLRPYVSISPVKGWHLDANALLFHLVHRGNSYGHIISSSITTGELEVNNQFRFNHGWSAELNGFFPGRMGGAQTVNDGFWRLDAGLQKSILHTNGNLRLVLNDIFHTVKFHERTTLPAEMTAVRYSSSDTRRVGVSFSYRFGKQANARKRNHNTGGAEDEQGRVN